MKKLIAVLAVMAVATGVSAQTYLVDTDLDDSALVATGTFGVTSTITLSNGDTVSEDVNGMFGDFKNDPPGTADIGWMDTLDEAGDGKDGDHPDSEWLAGNGGHIAIEDDQGNLPEFRNPGDPTGRRWIGSYTGAPGDWERISYTHVVTASEVASDNGNPYVAVADFKNTVKRNDNRRVSYRLDARMNGDTMASSEKIYFANGTEVQTGDIDVGDAASGWAVDGVEVQDVNSGIFSASIDEGDEIGLRLFGAVNDPANVDKGLGVAMSNLRVAQLADGDADGDLDVDNTDLGVAFGSFDPAATDKGWTDGDFDGDGDVDNTDLGAAFGNFGAGMAGEGSIADLIYDPATGGVILDGTEAPGGIINNFVLVDDEGGLTPTTTFEGGTFFTNEEDEISWTDGTTEGLSTIDLGEILPADMTLAEVEDMLETATYVGELGSGVHSFEVVPEPMTMSLLAIGGLGVLIRRKRR